MSLENVFGPNGLTYCPAVSEEMRLFRFPDGVVRAFRHLSAEWALFELYIANRNPQLQDALIKKIFEYTVQLNQRGDHLTFEQRLQVSARQAFIDLPRRSMFCHDWPANGSHKERNLRKVI